MKRIIYSLYIDIPKEMLDYQPPYLGDTLPKTERTKLLFQEWSPWLTKMHEQYADKIGVDYKLFIADKKYLDYQAWFQNKYPQITGYNIVNFYKLHLLYELANEYDEILYLDFDAVPVTAENFFDVWNLNDGIAIKTSTDRAVQFLEHILFDERQRKKFGKASNRSPTAKYWNQRAMVLYDGIDGDYSQVFNTGIIGINREHLNRLNYFDDFDYVMNMMDELKEDDNGMWPDYVRSMFGWDNETIWGYKTMLNKVPTQLLDNDWHMFFDKTSHIQREAKIIHVVNKRFSYVKSWCKENNIQHLYE